MSQPGFVRSLTWSACSHRLSRFARLRALGVQYVVVHLAEYPRPGARFMATRQSLERAVRRGDIGLVAKEGLDHLYWIRPVIPGRFSALLGNLPWEDVAFIGVGSESILREARSLGPTFGLFGRDQFIVYMEKTTQASRLLLKLPRSMTGEFLDVESGTVLQHLSVPVTPTGSPTCVAVPPGREAVLLALRAR